MQTNSKQFAHLLQPESAAKSVPQGAAALIINAGKKRRAEPSELAEAALKGAAAQIVAAGKLRRGEI